jgi:hypothetical protein
MGGGGSGGGRGCNFQYSLYVQQVTKRSFPFVNTKQISATSFTKFRRDYSLKYYTEHKILNIKYVPDAHSF